MTPVERLQAAIEKLEQLKAESTPGPIELVTRRLICRYPECSDRVAANWLCRDHLMLSKVTTGPGCWSWSGSLTRHGYAQYASGKKVFRRMYELAYGPIPTGFVPDHLCRNRACVNPSHLEAVTPRENTLRGDGPSARAARATHCPQGHAYDEENTYTPPSGGRYCRKCVAENDRKNRAKYAGRVFVASCETCGTLGEPIGKSTAYQRVRSHVAATGHLALADAILGSDQ